jgi:predicted nucleic acid-binding protein
MKAFVDSCIFIETFKENGKEEASRIFEYLLKALFDLENVFFVNAIVYSEVIYKLITKKKRKKEIIEKFVFRLFETFDWLDIPYPLKNLAVSYYKKYKLKPNDALILATCKHYNIKYLISIDNDFAIPCEKEGIILINSIEKLKEVLNNQSS